MNEAEIHDFADRYIAAFETGDSRLARTLFAPHARIWHNTDRVEQSVDEAMAVLEWLAAKLPDQKCKVIRRELLRDGFVQMDELHATLPDGSLLRFSACMVVKMEQGRIVRIDEYLDSAEIQPLRRLRS